VTEKIVVRKGTYHDSAFLMRVTRELKGQPDIEDAVVLMGTPMNLELLRDAGFDGVPDGVAPMDMVIAIRGAGDEAIGAAEKALAKMLEGGETSSASGAARRCRDLGEAVALFPESNLVSISVPGAYAAYVAGRALDAGKHVFLFSNNVSVEDEVALKRRARELGLLVMGPDCGTAIIAGVGLGFANRVPRGSIGVVGASGTGMQDITCTIAASGEGISQAIGTGGRDLSKELDGAMTEFGARLLADDPATKVICVVAKHPAQEVANRIHGVLKGLGKPVVVRYMGKPARLGDDGVYYASTIDEAAWAAVALARGQSPRECDDIAVDPDAKARELVGKGKKLSGRLVGLYSGGSLAYEAGLLLAQRGIKTIAPEVPLKSSGPVEFLGNLIIDTGEDFYTVGKPHPMVDQTVRCELIRKAGADPSVGLLLLDLVLGDGSHANPGPEIAEAVGAARNARNGRPLVVVASITGTDADPQVASRQRAYLEAAQIEVQPTAESAAMLAAALLKL
jgi:FdrA protein